MTMPPPASRRLRGFVRRPGPTEIRDLAEREFYHLSDEEATAYAEAVGRVLALVDRLDEVPLAPVAVRHGRRDAGRTPSRDDDPLNAFIRHCRVTGAGSGPLHGLRVGVKDNIAIAGIPLTNGSRTMPYVPT